MKQQLHKSLRLAATLLVALSASSAWGSFPIDITFSAEGESTNVQSVTVTNLMQTAVSPVTLSGTDILRLVDPDDPDAIEGTEELKVVTQPILTPNPSMGDGTLIFDAKSEGPVRVSVYTTDGMLLDAATLNVTKGRNTALIPSQARGIYIVNVEGQGVKSSTRWICRGSKSFSGIALGGAQQWAETALPTKSVFKSPAQNKAAASNVVMMDFHDGDILRFEGKSGQMRTIVVNSPKHSHSQSFYFYPCKDANGNTYPIVEAGGMLWMAEDLKCTKGISAQSQAARYADAVRTGAQNLALKVSSDDIYYTYSAAKTALPEGWSLPTLGELDAVVKELGGYDVVGDKMQRAGDHPLAFPSKSGDLPDSLQLGINAMGYVGEDGVPTNYSSGFIMTSTRENGGAICMKIIDGHKEGVMTTKDNNGKDVPLTLKKYEAVHVRGVRPAPSPYTDMMVELCGKAANTRAASKAKADGSKETNPWTGDVNPFTGTPYGEYYNVDYSTKQIVLDVAGQNSECFYYFPQCQLDKAYYGTNFVDANNGSLTQKKPDPEWITNANGNRLNRTYLKKLRPQKMADGTFNTLKLSFDVPVRSHANDGSANPAWMARDLENRDGHLILEVFGNKESDFATLATITLPETYKMPAFDGAYSEASQNTYVNEFFLKRLNLLTADFNNDGVDDVVVGFCGKWTVLDGKDYTTVLAQRTFETDCVRACVDDLDANGTPDFGIICQQNNQIFVYVLLNDINKFDGTKYPKLNVNGCRDYYATLPVGKTGVSSFLDIKFADITNTGNSVLCFTAPNSIYSDGAQSTFYVLDRSDETNELQTSYTLKEDVAFGLSNMSSDNSCTSSNSTIAVVHTRGMGERPDILLRNGLYRLNNDNNKFEKVNIGGCKDGGTMIDAIIPSDCVAVGRFSDDLPDGYEQLAYFGNRIAESLSSMGWYHSASGQWFQMMTSKEQYVYGVTELLTPDPKNGTMTRKELHTGVVASLNWCSEVSGSAGIHYSASLPAFCATSYDNIDTRRFKFVSCDATMTEPRIKYMLAAAPYYKGYEYTNGPSTSWVKADSKAFSDGYSNGTKASLIFGFEQENKISVFGIELGKFGFEFETEISHEWEKSFNSTNTFTWETGCSTEGDDVVGLSMTPVWLYTYECIDSNDPDNIGEKLVCGAPSTPCDLSITLSDYMRLRADCEEIPDLSTVFTHTPGDPFSYINEPTDMEHIGKGHIWGLSNNKNDYVKTGSGSTNTISIQMSQALEEQTTNTFSLEMSLVGFAGGLNNTVKAGVGAGYKHTWTTGYTTERGTTVSGTVPAPKQLGAVPMFKWNLCRYVMNVDGQEFPVVNYVVRKLN